MREILAGTRNSSSTSTTHLTSPTNPSTLSLTMTEKPITFLPPSTDHRRLCNIINFFISNSVDSLTARRCKWKELDTGLPVPDRALPVVVPLARAASLGSEEVPSSVLGNDVQVFLRSYTVHHYCCRFLERYMKEGKRAHWR
ncbi:hypothetical protein ACFX2A_000318 [Malus domestica]